MQKNILISSFKIVLAAIGAIMVARLLHLEFAISAGIVAILTIQPTKRET
ncbi:MAG: aromatic acid exporter family protein, partial [Lachnospiraceae bacterium]|nr:aromatic acid exporter family protein [Lachnospiraceae bacterium]